MPDWCRRPYKKYGTSYRRIAAVAVLQIATVIISCGDVTLLGEAYAFGVACSFAMKALGVTVLRFTRPQAERWRVPCNVTFGTTEFPIGLILISLKLFLLAVMNLLTKEAATIGEVSFTLVFFVLFTVSEYYHKRGKASGDQHQEADRFRLECRHALSPETLGVRPGGILVAVHETDRLAHLETVLADSDPAKIDVTAVLVNAACSTEQLSDDKAAAMIVDAWETLVFTAVVAVAEKAGRPITLVGLPSGDRYETILEAAGALQLSRLVLDASSKDSVEEQSGNVRAAWTRLSEHRHVISVTIAGEDGAKPRCFTLDDAAGPK